MKFFHCLEAGDLVRLADSAAAAGASVISCHPDNAGMLWTWLEGKGIDSLVRFDAENINDMSAKISQAFKRGANGAIIYVRAPEISEFASALSPIRTDLFFNKKLLIALDISEVSDWGLAFHNLHKINADGIVLFAAGKKAKVDHFIGQLYGFISAASEWTGDIYFDFGDEHQIESAQRLSEKMLEREVRFFSDQ
jgi:hypothetical protein